MEKYPHFLRDKNVDRILRGVISSMPKKSKLFLIGGTLRNTVFYYYFKKELPQRDYDVIFIGNKELFIRNLRKKGFLYGKIRRQKQLVLKKRKFPKAKSIEDYLVLDISFYKGQNIENILKEKINFTINAFAINLKDIFLNNWFDSLIALDGSFKDMKAKKLRLNPGREKVFGSDLYACIRFMSRGFQPPPREEIQELFLGLKYLEKYRFDKNIAKMYSYVGGEKKARLIAKKLGLEGDIFSFNTVKKLRAKE